MVGRTSEALHADALRLRDLLGSLVGLTVSVEGCMSTVGGGAMPTAQLPSWAIVIAGKSAQSVDAKLRAAPVPVVARIEHGKVWLDVRTIGEEEFPDVVAALRA
jgi:L-seryl-tRNA(Ser) seleniumtransferase